MEDLVSCDLLASQLAEDLVLSPEKISPGISPRFLASNNEE